MEELGKRKRLLGKRKRLLEKMRKIYFFFFSFVQIPIHPEILHYYTIRLQRYVTTALEINNVDENKYVAIRKYEKEKMRKERKKMSASAAVKIESTAVSSYD